MRRNSCQRHLLSLTFSTHLAGVCDSHINYLLSIGVLIWLLLLYWISLCLITLCRTHYHLRFIIVRLLVHSAWYPTYGPSRWVFLWSKLAMWCYHLLVKSCSLARVCMLRAEALRLEISVSILFRCNLRNVCIRWRCSIRAAFRRLECFITFISIVINLSIKFFIWDDVEFAWWLDCILMMLWPHLWLTWH